MLKLIKGLFLLFIILSVLTPSFPVVQAEKSPDPYFIIFVSTRDGFEQIYRMEADGSNQKRLTMSATAFFKPTVSSTGEGIVFYENNYTSSIHYISTDGTNLRFLAHGFDPQWSIDGKQIFYTDSINIGIYRINIDGSSLQKLSSNDSRSWLYTITPDGEWLIFSSMLHDPTNLYRMGIDGSNLESLPDHSWANYFSSSLTPDGEWIINRHRPDLLSTKVYLTKLDGSVNQILLTLPHGGYFDFRLSPNGEWLAFNQRITFNKITLNVYKIGDADIRTLTQHYQRDVDFSWSPDSQWILFESDRNGVSDIYKIRPDGTDLQNLSNNPNWDVQPRWAINPEVNR